jgi:hypothetical protein
LTLTNSGGEPLESIAVTASTGFEETNSCTTQLAANSSCAIAVQFAPTQPGNVTGTLTVADALRTQTVSLSGLAVAPAAISVSPASVTFANQQPGVASAPQTLTITNTGGAPMANIGFQITGPAAASYAVSVTNCGAVLNSGSICTAQVIFTPASTGPISATLAVSSSTAGVTAVSVPLNGAGQLSASLKVLPSLLTFPAVGIGQSSAAQSITITNAGNLALAAVTLSVAAPFAIPQNTCSGGLAVGASCSAQVIFTPAAVGPASGTSTVSSAMVANPAVILLSGTGFDFSISASGPGSITVASGQTANFPFAITPTGSQGVFSFACGAIPNNASCSFNPPSESLNLGVEGNVTAVIATSQSSSAAIANPRGSVRALRLLCGLLLLPLLVVRRRRLLVLGALLAVVTVWAVSCTSSSGGTGGSPAGASGNTPPGTYTIPITITSTGVSHSLNLTLTVD